MDRVVEKSTSIAAIENALQVLRAQRATPQELGAIFRALAHLTDTATGIAIEHEPSLVRCRMTLEPLGSLAVHQLTALASQYEGIRPVEAISTAVPGGES